jgi:carboxylesterase type B
LRDIADSLLDEAYFRPPTVVMFDDSIRALWPDISDSAFATIESLYPPADFGNNETVRFLQCDADYQFNCKIYAVSNAFNGQTYKYYFSVPPAIHTADDPYTFNGGLHEMDGDVTNSTVADILQKYLISFIKTGNPNTEYPGLLNWPTYGTNGGTEININETLIELMPTDLDTPQCQWWVQGLY